MKPTQIAIAIAALMAGSVSAATIEFTVSGATALNKSFEKTVSDMCNAPASSYTSTSGAKPAVRYQCPAKAGLGIGGVNPGDTLIINKEQGGSSTGVTQVNNSTPVTVALTSGCTASTTGPLVPGGVSFTKWTGCASGTKVPDAGISDVEPKLVGTATANLSNAGVVAQVFGMAVSDNVYAALQTAQGKVVGDFSEAQAPSLPASFVRGAFSGNANDWSAVDPALAGPVKVCRRAKGSGTLATFEATVMLNPCSTSPTYGGALTLSTAATDDTTLNDSNPGFLGTTGVYTVVENGSSEAVDTCLTQAHTQGEQAIGILGTERQRGDSGVKTGGSDDNDGLNDNWRYVKIGQVYPSVANFVAGDYDFYWAEASFNRRKSGYTATQTNLMNHFQTKMGDPVAISSLPLPGLAALTSNGYTFDYGATPVSRAARNGNTCQMGVQVF